MAGSHIDRIREQFTRQAEAYARMRQATDERGLGLLVALAGTTVGDRVLDVACGPGNFTRAFAAAARASGAGARGAGVVVGLDASSTMLAQAAREKRVADETYVRASATDLPFRDASFDAVCCFAALYLIEEPLKAVAEIARVVAPGGRIALLSSVARGPLPAGVSDAFVRPLTGVRIFGRDALTRELRAQGLADVRQRVSGLAQFVSARRQGSNPAGP